MINKKVISVFMVSMMLSSIFMPVRAEGSPVSDPGIQLEMQNDDGGTLPEPGDVPESSGDDANEAVKASDLANENDQESKTDPGSEDPSLDNNNASSSNAVDGQDDSGSPDTIQDVYNSSLDKNESVPDGPVEDNGVDAEEDAESDREAVTASDKTDPQPVPNQSSVGVGVIEDNNKSESTTQASIPVNTPDTQPANMQGTLVFDLDPVSQVYTGSELKPQVLNVRAQKDNVWSALSPDQYDVAYYNNVNAGTASVEVKGRAGTPYENCSLKKDFVIAKADQTLIVKANRPSIKYRKKGRVYVSGAFGTVKFSSSNKKVLVVNNSGVYSTKVTGKVKINVSAAGDANHNPANASVTINVTGKDISKSNTKVKLKKQKYTYDGKAKKPGVTVKYKGKKLKRGRDYKVIYKDNVMPGKATATIIGTGTYSGKKVRRFTINKANNPIKVKFPDGMVDVNKMRKIIVRKAVGKVTFTSSSPSIASVNEKGVIKGLKRGVCSITVKATGSATHKGYKKTFKLYVGLYDISRAVVKLSGKDFVYSGSEIRPGVTVRSNGKLLKEGTDYTLSYKDNTNAGTAQAIITGKGKGINRKIVYFCISKAEGQKLSGPSDMIRTSVGSTFEISVSGGNGRLTYSTDYPSYVKVLGNGKFQALKPTKNYVTVVATSEGDKNHKSSSIVVRVNIAAQGNASSSSN